MIIRTSLGIIALGAALAAWHVFGGSVDTFEELSSGLSTPQEYIELGIRLEDTGQTADAVRAYRAAIDLDTAYQQLVAYDAIARVYQNNSTLAEESSELGHLYLRGLAQNPTSRFFMRGLAEHYERIGREEQAVVWYQKILQLYPADRNAYGKVLEFQKRQ